MMIRVKRGISDRYFLAHRLSLVHITEKKINALRAHFNDAKTNFVNETVMNLARAH